MTISAAEAPALGQSSAVDGSPAVTQGPGSCDASALGAALRDLFPPASSERRRASAALVSSCRVPGTEGALAAGLAQATDETSALALASGLAEFPTEVAHLALRQLLRDTSRSGSWLTVDVVALQALARAGDVAPLVDVVNDPTRADALRAAALQALADTRHRPSIAYLEWAGKTGSPQLETVANRLLDASRTASPTSVSPETGSVPPPPASVLASASVSSASASLRAKPAGTAGLSDGRVLTVGASTVAGATLFSNLSRLGLQGATPQLLLGSAGGVIGFGTAWALSRFGVRPTVYEAAWFANTTAWGTLAGLTVYAGSGGSSSKLESGSLIAGEIAGMAAGVWSASRWTFTLGDVALADSLFLGTALAGIGVMRVRDEPVHIGSTFAAGVVPAMIASAIVGHALAPTTNDLVLMTGLGASGAWLGSLLGSGLGRASWLDSPQGQGGLMLGASVGYFAGATAGAFTDVAPARVRTGAFAMLAGNALGLGVDMMATGFARSADGQSLHPGDSDSWKLGAGLGGLALGGLGFAFDGRLWVGPDAPTLGAWGVAYGAGIYALSSTASRHGQPVTDADTAAMQGGILALGLMGGLGGLWLSDRFHPDARDQATSFGITASALSLGWGTTALLVDARGAADGVGIAAGAALGLSAGALFTHSNRLTEPALAASGPGLGYGALVGTLVPSLGRVEWQGDRRTEAGALLGMGAGTLGAAALAQATGASGGEVLATSVAGVLGLGLGFGVGAMLTTPGPPDTIGSSAPDGSRARRLGAVTGTSAVLGGAILFGRPLHLATPIPPGSSPLILTATTLGLYDGLLLASSASPGDHGGGPSGLQRQGGWLLGTALGIGTGLFLAPRLATRDDALVVTGSATAAGSALGYGLALLVADAPTRAEPRLTLAGSLFGTMGGIAAARDLDFRLDTSELGAAIVGTGAGAFVGALVPSATEAAWPGWNRPDSGGAWIGAGAGAILGAATVHATHIGSDAVGTVTAAGIDGLGTGLGVGLLLEAPSRSGDRPVRIGMLTGTLAGFGLGAGLHDRIHVGGDAAPLVTLGTIEGVWAGVVGPYLFQPAAQVGRRAGNGGVLAGGFGGLGLSVLGSTFWRPTVENTTAAGVGSALGASAAGGIALLSRDLHDESAAGLTLGGSTAGLITGGLLASRDQLRLQSRAAGYGVVGGALGVAEATTFTWSARASGRDPYLGAGLLGASVGASLGIASASVARDSQSSTPALAGLAAWGGWMGAFAGALVARDPHEITGGGLLGTNIGLLAGYGALRSGLVAAGDFGWLSLGAALGTAVGAGAGAPFASPGEGRPVLAGLAIGPAVGMTAAGLLLARFRRSHPGVAGPPPAPVSGGGRGGRRGDDAATDIVGNERGSTPSGRTSPLDDPAVAATASQVVVGDGVSGEPPGRAPDGVGQAPAATASPAILADLDRKNQVVRVRMRAIKASLRIEDWAPLVGALPASRDAPPSRGSPPLFFGLTGRWN